MGDSKNLDQLKNQYRIRFYRNSVEDVPQLRPGTNVLSAIKDYFNDSGEVLESPEFSRSTFLTDNVTNNNIPESIQKKQVFSAKPRISNLNGHLSTGEIDETIMKVTAPPEVSEKVTPATHFNNFDANDSEEEINDCESDMPLNLVIEKETEIVRSVRNVSRDRIYSSDCSVVQGPPSPASKSSPQKRLRFSDAAVKDRESFAHVFTSSYNRGSANEVQALQTHESVSCAEKNDPTLNRSTAVEQEDEEFVIEDEQSINMSFSLVKKRSSIGSSKEAKLPISNSSCGNEKRQRKTSEVFSGKSPLYLSKSQSTRKENSSNVKRDTKESEKNLDNERPIETKLTSSSATFESQKSSAFKVLPEQPLPHSKMIQQTRQANKELEMEDEENFDLIWDTNRTKIKIPRNPKSKAESSKSSRGNHVSHHILEVEPAETVSEQSTVQSQRGNTLRNDKTNKAKGTLPKDKSSFTAHLAKFAKSEPPIKRMDNTDILDLPVAAEDEEFVIHDISDLDSDSKIWSKKTSKIPNDNKKNKKKEKNVASKALNVTYTNSRVITSSVTDSRKNNKATDASHPLNDKKEKKSRSTEVGRLALQKYLQDDVDEQNGSSSLRPKRVSAPPSAWWVVQQTGRTSRFEMEKGLLQHSSKSKRKAPAEPEDRSEWQNDKDESLQLKERPRGQDEGTVLKINEKTSKTLNTRKRATKVKPNESEETREPLEVKRLKNNKFRKKFQTSPKKSRQSTNLRKQLEYETQESDATSCHEHDLNDLPNEIDRLSMPARDVSPPMSEPQCVSPHRNEPIIDERSRESSASGCDIEVEYLQKYRSNEERETQPHHSQRGSVLKTRSVRHINQMDPYVQNVTSARKASSEPEESSKWQNDKEESLQLKEGPRGQDEGTFLKMPDEKTSKILNTRKRTTKVKPDESEKMAGPSKVKRLKKNKASEKSQTSKPKSFQSKDLRKQQEGDSHCHENYLTNDIDRLTMPALPASPPMTEPSQCSSPQRLTPIIDESSRESYASGSGIQTENLKNYVSTEVRETQPHHRPPSQSHTPTVCDSPKLSFQSGSVEKIRAVSYNNQEDPVVQNLTSAEALNGMDPFAIVFDADTGSDTIADCIHQANSGGHDNPSVMLRCFNNHIFSTGKLVVKSMEEEIRDTPQFDILIFYITSGKIVLKLHKSYHNLKGGDFFFIPPNNKYCIRNYAAEDAELIFTQLKPRSE